MAYESTQEIYPGDNFSINIQNGFPSKIEIALRGNGQTRQTPVQIGFIDAVGPPFLTGVLLDSDNRSSIVSNFTAGTTSLYITNMGRDEIINVWW
jgi:hypothetical protein